MPTDPPTGHHAHKLLKQGQPAAAVVRQSRKLPKDRGTWHYDVLVDVEVQPDAGAPFAAQAIIEDLHNVGADALKDGARLVVRFDPKDGATVIDRSQTDWLHHNVNVADEALRAMRAMEWETERTEIESLGGSDDMDDEMSDQLEAAQALIEKLSELKQGGGQTAGALVAAVHVLTQLDEVTVARVTLHVQPSNGGAVYAAFSDLAWPTTAQLPAVGSQVNVRVDPATPVLVYLPRHV
jgi:hypothetical protein